MYIHFYPQCNFIRDFPVKNRPVFIAETIGLTQKTEKLLNCFPGHGTISGKNLQEAFLLIAPINESSCFESLYNKLPNRFRELTPQSFIVLLPDEKAPVIWLGGSSVSGVNETLEYCFKIFPSLTSAIPAAGDFHVHSNVSDGKTPPEEILFEAKRARLDIIALTDHNSDDGYNRMMTCSDKYSSIIPLRGMELTDSKSNHVLAIGNASGLPHAAPQEIINAAREEKVFIAQAHATSQEYFTELKDDVFIATEAFNHLSSAPETAREYIKGSIAKGGKVAALGNSDAHTSSGIGKARTFLLLPEFSEKAVISELRAGRTCAFMDGHFSGEPGILELFSYIYNHSNLLAGKLVPGPDVFYKQIENTVTVPAATQLKPCRRGKSKTGVFCAVENCDCHEEHFEIPGTMSFLQCGDVADLLFSANGIKDYLQLPSSDKLNLQKYLHKGKNIIRYSLVSGKAAPIRLCTGQELKNWELKKAGTADYLNIGHAANLQIQEIAPVGFSGTFTYRASFDNYDECNTLFFESIDGNIQISVNGRLLATRSNAHWEDCFEITLPDDLKREEKLEIVIELNSKVGLCGISNHVYAGHSEPFAADADRCLNLDHMPDLTELRLGEQRIRCFFLNKEGRILDSFFADGTIKKIPAGTVSLHTNSVSAIHETIKGN